MNTNDNYGQISGAKKQANKKQGAVAMFSIFPAQLRCKISAYGGPSIVIFCPQVQ
ncbi:hypothetical protein [Microbulbifer sp. PSTR4-B]|uniref:hypothetical protein n=1 Tax=Microbulbifer sp. PSTR4-B TaxID=3243396 RepID=UPI004039E4B8